MHQNVAGFLFRSKHFGIFTKCSDFYFFDISLRCKFESSGYGVSSTIQKSSKYKFNPNPSLQSRYRSFTAFTALTSRGSPESFGRRCTRPATSLQSRAWSAAPRTPAAYLPGPCSIGQTCQGSFSAVSKPNFASKYAFESSRRDLHNALLFTAAAPSLRPLSGTETTAR